MSDDGEFQASDAATRIEPEDGSELREQDGLLVIHASGAFIDDALVRELLDADRVQRLGVHASSTLGR